jgi:hypothetical protein
MELFNEVLERARKCTAVKSGGKYRSLEKKALSLQKRAHARPGQQLGLHRLNRMPRAADYGVRDVLVRSARKHGQE